MTIEILSTGHIRIWCGVTKHLLKIKVNNKAVVIAFVPIEEEFTWHFNSCMLKRRRAKCKVYSAPSTKIRSERFVFRKSHLSDTNKSKNFTQMLWNGNIFTIFIPITQQNFQIGEINFISFTNRTRLCLKLQQGLALGRFILINMDYCWW